MSDPRLDLGAACERPQHRVPGFNEPLRKIKADHGLIFRDEDAEGASGRCAY
jgi:hypothetical protein